MSYILNALRKSSEERKKLQELSSNPLRPLANIGQTGRLKRRHLFWASISTAATVVFAAGLAFYLLNDSPESSQIPAPTHQEEPTAATGQTAIQPDPQPAPSQDEFISAQAASTTTGTPDAQGPDNPSAVTVPPQSPQPTAVENIPLLGDLPLATRALIPEMKFSGHVYSAAPSRRMIMINTTIAREGDMITPDIRLEEITDSGLILKYQATLFKVELF